MEDGESISKMFDRFSVIVNGLKGYGEMIQKDKLVRKLLYSLPESWDGKRTAIIEAKNLKTLKLDELVGSLLTHEIMVQGREEEKKKKEKNIVKIEAERKKQGIALKASLQQDESSSNEKDKLEELAMIVKRFSRLMKSNRGKRFQRKRDFKNKEEKDPIICYECKKPGHMKAECPQLKQENYVKTKKKHRAHIATWSDEESMDDEKDEVANLCLMALEENQEVNTLNSSLTYEELYNDFDELQCVYDELVEEFKNSVLKNKKIISDSKTKNDFLTKTNLELENKILIFEKLSNDLKNKNLDLDNKISNLKDCHTKEVDNLKKSLTIERTFKKENNSKGQFVKRNNFHHKQKHFQRHYNKKVKSVWVPKELIKSNNIVAISSWIPKGTKILRTNSHGLKMVWVPKIKN